MQVVAPEGLAMYHRSIPASFSKYYMDHQEHFSLKELLGKLVKEMDAG
jgi:tryptophan 2,3-dioxygenase